MEFHEYANLFPLMANDEYQALVADMQTNGYDITFPVMLYEGKILDGRNRYRAAQEAGIAPAYANYTGTDPLAYVLRSNLHRRHLNETQRAVIAARLANMPLGGAVYRSANLQTEKQVSQTQAAEMLSVSPRTVATVKAIEKAAPDLLPAMETGTMTAHAATAEVQRRVNAAQPRPAAPSGKYRCLVIDPPWPMEKIERTERPNQVAPLDYPVMSLDEISALPISALADPAGCHIYLWVTQRFLPAGLELFCKWGVKYQCLFTWVKNVGFTPFSWMYDTEHVLFGRIGSLPLDKLGLRLSFAAPVTRHSEKPETFYSERVLLASPPPRLEMFARKQREGFEVWGNEVSG